MLNFCIQQEREGYAKLVQLLRKYGGYSWMSGVLKRSTNDWTKRGARRDRLIAYEVEHEVDAFLDLQYLAQHKPGIQADVANRCLDEWSAGSVRWSLVEYCYKRATGTD